MSSLSPFPREARQRPRPRPRSSSYSRSSGIASLQSTSTSRATCRRVSASRHRHLSRPQRQRSSTLRPHCVEAAEPAPTVPGADVIVGAHDLTALQQQPPPDLVTSLRDMLPTVKDRWDSVVIDTPPNIGALTLAGLAAADHVIVSVELATEAYDQIGRLEAVIDGQLTRRIRPGLSVDAIVPTKVDTRRLLDREVLALLTDRFGERVTPTIRSAVAVRDAYTAGMTVSAYDPGSAVAADYKAAIDHLLAITKGTHHG